MVPNGCVSFNICSKSLERWERCGVSVKGRSKIHGRLLHLGQGTPLSQTFKPLECVVDENPVFRRLLAVLVL